MKKEFLDHPRPKNSNFEFTIDISRAVETVFPNERSKNRIIIGTSVIKKC